MLKDSLVFKFTVLPLVLLGCCAGMNRAQASGYLPPRLSLGANTGGSATVGRADLLLSLKGDDQRNLYLDPQASYGSDEQWYTDLGLGYRWIQNDAAILGAYLFAGHSQVERQSGFWIANPGVEAMGSRWDARINGYIPVGGRSDDLGIVRFNQSSRFVFSGHTERLVTSYLIGDETQQIGDGVDARVGYQVFRNVPLKAYLGGYFFDIPHTDNVRGGAAGLEYWFDDHVKVFANYTYDNLQHSTVVGGLAVSFGGVDEARADPSLSERLTDPVDRYLANLGHGSGIPSETMIKNLRTGTERVLSTDSINDLPEGGGSEIVAVNMAFFSANGSPNNGGVGLTLDDCTPEKPCGPTDFSETGVNTLNTLLPKTQMFFSDAVYPATNGSSALALKSGSGALTLNNGQSVWGRTADYSAPAETVARPVFNGAFILNGNNTLDSIILDNTLGATATAISSNGGQNILINNVLIGDVLLGRPYEIGMNLVGASVTLTNSFMFASGQNSQSTLLTRGISLESSTLIVKSSWIKVSNPLADINPDGIFLNNSTLLFDDSKLFFDSKGGDANLTAAGIDAQGDSKAIITSNSEITVTAEAQKAIGLSNSNSATTQMHGGSLIVTGVNPGALLTLGKVQLTNVSCQLNGEIVLCNS